MRPRDNSASHRGSWEAAACGAVFIAAFAIYAWTRAPTVTLVDSGELAVVARTWGVAHPPGFPLWTILAHFASIVPFGRVASRINLSSAFFASLAAMLVTLAMIYTSLLWRISTPASGKKPRRKIVGPLRANPMFLVAISTGLLLAFSRTLWNYATITEVYALNTALILLIIALMLRWAARVLETQKTPDNSKATGHRRRDTLLYMAAGVFGLALGVHHVTVGLTLPAFAVLVYRTEGATFFKSRRFASAAIISFAALFAVYSYLPVAASHRPLINWGTPVSLRSIWEHVSGRQYQTFLTFEPAAMAKQFYEFGRICLGEFGPPWLPFVLVLAVVGLWQSFREVRSLFWFLLLLILANVAYCLSYNIAEDKDAYYLVTFVALTIAAGVGLQWLFGLVLAARFSHVGRATVLLGFCVLPLIALISHWSFNNRRHDWIAHDYVGNIFRSVEPNGLLLTYDWQVASPALYLQHVEQRRPDVTVVDVNLLRRSWYFDYLNRCHPDLMARSHAEVDSFLTELRQWERDESAYTTNEAATRITAKFDELVASLVRSQMSVGPVYVTLDFLSPDQVNAETSKVVTGHYGLVPEGLLFKLVPDRAAFHFPRSVRISKRGLTHGIQKFDKDDVVRAKVFPVYTTMFLNRGRYLAAYGQDRLAVAAFTEALALDPNLEMAKRELELSKSRLPSP